MHSRNFFTMPRRPMFGRRVSREEEDEEDTRSTHPSFWDTWRTKKPSTSTVTISSNRSSSSSNSSSSSSNGHGSSSSSRAITSSNHHRPSSSSSSSSSSLEGSTSGQEIDAGFWRWVERVLFTRLEEGGRVPLVELVEAIRGCSFLQKTYGSANIEALLNPLDGSITSPPPYVRLTHSPTVNTVEVVWVTLAEFRSKCESSVPPTAPSSLVPTVEGRAISPKRRRANHDHQGGHALTSTPLPQPASAAASAAATGASPSSVQASVDMQKDSFLALLSTLSKEYRAQEAQAEAEAAALGARADGVLDAFGQQDDSLRSAIEEMEAQLEGRTLERKKTGAKDRRDREAELEKRMAVDMSEAIVRQRLAPLSEEDQNEVRLTLKNGRDLDIVVNGFSVDILRQHLRTCRPGTWLNDEVINFFMNILKERDNAMVAADPSRLPNWFFNSFFITKLLHDDREYRYANVKRWSRKAKDLFAYNKVFFPVNINNSHWCLAVIYIQEKKIQYFDSMCGRGEEYLTGLKRYLQDEHQDKKKAPLPSPDEWKLVYSDPKITPQQGNGFDCGCFASAFAYLLSEDLPIKYASQSDMPAFRQRLVMSIMKKSVSW